MSVVPAGQPSWVPALVVGDIEADAHWVRTPSGVVPVADVTWSVQDLSRHERAIPTWAVVCAIVFAFFCLLGLFFLLVKDERTTGWVQVTVQARGFVHTTQVPVSTPGAVARVHATVNHGRSLTAAAG